MTKILVLHGAGMNMRGKVQVEVFGPMTLPEYDARIRNYAQAQGIEVEIFHSNVEGEIIDKLYEAAERGFDGAIFNPAGHMAGYPALAAAVAQAPFPTIEVHISNPARRGKTSDIAGVAFACIAGCGIAGYDLALRGLKTITAR